MMFFYDFLEVFRRKVKHAKAVRWLEDWLFWAVAAILVFQMIFALNNGILRSFFVVSFVVGMVGYKKMAKGHVIDAVCAIITWIFRPYVWILKKIKKKNKKTLK
ncbi:MAG: spore cortex biosynthesis protein YabQ [Lachnospiraceae bacterium]|nr:spore cortex biosynthesis protein YabQ [Lachnospiraceae bacterium]